MLTTCAIVSSIEILFLEGVQINMQPSLILGLPVSRWIIRELLLRIRNNLVI